MFAALPAPMHEALLGAYVSGGVVDPAWLPELVGPWVGVDGQAAFYRQIAALRPEDTRPIAARLGEVRAPVWILWGEADPWLPVEQAQRLAALLPGTPEVTLLPGVGHLIPLEAPDAVVEAVAVR